MKLIAYLFTLMAVFAANQILAQDTIFKRNSDVIPCQIVEIGVSVIRVKLPSDLGRIETYIKKENVRKIIFSNGAVLDFEEEINTLKRIGNGRNDAIKFAFLSPLFGYTGLWYEHGLRPNRSIEAGFGIIGLGLENYEHARGISVRTGYKFMPMIGLNQNNSQNTMIQSGIYLKPEVIIELNSKMLTYYSKHVKENGSVEYLRGEDRKLCVTQACQFIAGYQAVIDNTFLIDICGGVGFGYQILNTKKYDYIPNYYGYALRNNFGIVYSTGLKIGYIF